MRKRTSIIVGLLAVSAAAVWNIAPSAAADERTGTLRIVVSNVRVGQGHVHMAICPQSLFLKDNCPYKATVPARQGETEVVIDGIPAGTYSAQAYLDENDNDRLDRTLLGIPEEGVGFSGDPSYTVSPPDFQETAFTFDGVSGSITFRLRYY